MLTAIRQQFVIPIPTSLIRHEPVYYRPLLEAVYNRYLPDGDRQITMRAAPEDLPVTMREKYFATIEDEVAAIKHEFSIYTSPETGGTVVTATYPGETLYQAILAEVELAEARVAKAAQKRRISTWLANLQITGLTDEQRQALTDIELGERSGIAAASPLRLAALPNISLTLARAIVAAAKSDDSDEEVVIADDDVSKVLTSAAR